MTKRHTHMLRRILLLFFIFLTVQKELGDVTGRVDGEDELNGVGEVKTMGPVVVLT